MNLRKRMFLVTAVVCAVASGAMGQLQLQSNGNLLIRSASTGNRSTDHYGAFNILCGNHCSGDYGRLTVQRSAYLERNLYVTSNLSVSGTKNFIHPHPIDEAKIIKYVAIESGEALTVARGTAKTENGEAIVALPEHFSLTTSSDVPVTVIFSPKKAPVQLYTKQDSKERIVVAMKKSDFTAFGDVEFAFQVTGVRDGFEKLDAIANTKEYYSSDFKEGWEDTEVGKRIFANSEKIRAWHREEREKNDREFESEE